MSFNSGQKVIRILTIIQNNWKNKKIGLQTYIFFLAYNRDMINSNYISIIVTVALYPLQKINCQNKKIKKKEKEKANRIIESHGYEFQVIQIFFRFNKI